MQLSYQSMDLIKSMAEIGNPNSVSDAGVGALCARAAVYGAYLNVKINAASYTDKIYVENVLLQANNLLTKANKLEADILNTVEQKIK